MTIILVVVGLLGGLCLVCCCGGVGAMYFGMNTVADQVKTRFENEPVVIDQIGGITSCSFNFAATGAKQSEREDTLVFDVEGPSGSGQLIVWSPSGDPTQPEEASIKVGGAEFTIIGPGGDLDSLLGQ